jgi:hypothetical protein
VLLGAEGVGLVVFVLPETVQAGGCGGGGGGGAGGDADGWGAAAGGAGGDGDGGGGGGRATELVGAEGDGVGGRAVGHIAGLGMGFEIEVDELVLRGDELELLMPRRRSAPGAAAGRWRRVEVDSVGLGLMLVERDRGKVLVRN